MPKNFLKNSLSKNFILPLRKGKRFIFIYHDISERNSLQHSSAYSTSVEKFKEQVDFLSGKFDWVNLDDIHKKESFKKNVASLVFDDGFKSVQTHAMPYLQKKGIPFSVFVSQSAVTNNRLWVSDLKFNKSQLEKDFSSEFSKDINSTQAFKLLEKNKAFQNQLNTTSLKKFEKEQIYLDAKDLLALHKQGVIIGNHGSTHANLQMCDEKSLQAEITGNKLFIENIIKSEVKHYALAFGKKEHYSPKAIDIIHQSGHAYIYSSNPSSFSRITKNRLTPRIGLTENSTKEIMFYINRQFLKKVDL